MANKIIVLKNGKVVELGDHRSLMAAKGEYYTLFSTQAARYISNENEHVRTDTEDLPHGGLSQGEPPQGETPQRDLKFDMPTHTPPPGAPSFPGPRPPRGGKE